METNEQDEVIADDVEDTSESVEENPEDTKVEKPEKSKRTPQEEYEYHKGRAERLAKKLGVAEKSEVKSDTSKPNDDLDFGEKAYLRSALNIKGADELQLAREWKKKYGVTAEEMETDEVFNARLTKLRETREAQEAMPKGKGRSAQTSVTDLDYAVAKFKESGELPPDFKTRNAVIDKITADEKGPSFHFK